MVEFGSCEEDSVGGNVGCCRSGVGNVGVVGVDADGMEHRLGVKGAVEVVPDTWGRRGIDACCTEEEGGPLPTMLPVGEKGG